MDTTTTVDQDAREDAALRVLGYIPGQPVAARIASCSGCAWRNGTHHEEQWGCDRVGTSCWDARGPLGACGPQAHLRLV